jgi:hypothetical protein
LAFTLKNIFLLLGIFVGINRIKIGEILGSHDNSMKRLSSGMLFCVVWHKLTDVLEAFSASIIRAMMMQKVNTFEMSVTFYQTTHSKIPEKKS